VERLLGLSARKKVTAIAIVRAVIYLPRDLAEVCWQSFEIGYESLLECTEVAVLDGGPAYASAHGQHLTGSARPGAQ